MKLHYICARAEHMKNMNPEIFTTLSILLVCLILLTLMDAVTCLILKFVAGIPFKKAFLWGCISLLIPPLAIAYGALIERNLFKVKETEIICETLPEAFDGYTIAHISDIHARSFEGREGRLHKAVDKINALSPNIIAFTGDLISMSPDELEGMADILGRLKADDGIFSVLGNHDYCMYNRHKSQAERMAEIKELQSRQRSYGWHLLLNEHQVVHHDGDSIAVVGVENSSRPPFPDYGNLPKALQVKGGKLPEFKILLSHDPTHWRREVLQKSDIQLQLSGHTHATQFCLFGWTPARFVYDEYAGLYEAQDGKTGAVSEKSQHASSRKLYICTGTGGNVTFRFGAWPEIVLIKLKGER